MDRTCAAHDDLVASVTAMTLAATALAGDLKWIISLGKWAVGLMGATVIMVVPIIATLVSHLNTMDSRITALETAQHRTVAELGGSHASIEMRRSN